MNTDIFPQDGKKKSLFKKPDTIFGMAVLATVVGWLGLKIFPILATLAWTATQFVVALCVLGFLLYILTSKKTWLFLHYLHEMTLKKLFGLVIELDPFIIAEDYIKDMEKERENLNQQNIQVNAQKEAIDARIKNKEAEKIKLTNRAKTAQKNNMMQEVGVAARQVDRIDDYIKQLLPIRESLTKIGAYLDKVYTNSQYLIEDAKNELSIKKEAWEGVTKGNAALSSAMKIFKGDPDKKFLVEQSMEFLKDDIALKLSNMKNSMKISSDFMNKIDLDNATFEESGLMMLEKFNPEGLKLNRGEPVMVKSYIPGKVNSDYNNLLD